MNTDSLDPSLDWQGRLRYFDPLEEKWLINVPAESFYVTPEDEILLTTLGSCVSACVYDTTYRVGGLNHFLLPRQPDGAGTDRALRYGSESMLELLSSLAGIGAQHTTLEAKVFGGGGTPSFGSDVGRSNIAFVKQYLNGEGIPIVAEDVGGPWARQVRFYPTTGRVRVRRLELSRRLQLVQGEQRLLERLSEPPGVDVEGARPR